VVDPGGDGWGDASPHWHPQCTKTGHFEVQNGKKFRGTAPPQTPPSVGRGIPSPHTLPLRGSARPHPPPMISGSATDNQRSHWTTSIAMVQNNGNKTL